jgi:hypothetical protein
MSYAQVLKLAEEFTSKIEPEEVSAMPPVANHSDFYWDSRTLLNRVLSELEMDLMHLKVRGLKREPVYHTLSTIRQQITNLVHDIGVHSPIEGIRALTGWSQLHKDFLESAYILSNKYLSKSMPDVPPYQAKGIPLLFKTLKQLNGRINQMHPGSTSETVRPPRM